LGLLALLVGRSVFYWQAGSSLNWDPGIPLSSIALVSHGNLVSGAAPPTVGICSNTLMFRSDLPGRMMLFSFFSFGATLGFFYLCLLLLSAVNAPVSDADPAQRLVRLHLGRLERWPVAVKLLLPLLVMTALWCALNPLLLWIDLVPPVSTWHLLAQGAVIGLAAYFALKFVVLGFLALYVLNSYIYLGDSPFLSFVNTTARGLLRPLHWLPLRLGRVDLAPLAGMALVLLAAEFGRRGLDCLHP
jgi:uncharacterized protein YggT (Ycf19 family)